MTYQINLDCDHIKVMIDPKKFEQMFIELVTRKAREQHLNHSEIAKKVFKTVIDPVRKWRAIRNVSKNKVHQPLSMEEAVQLSTEVGSDIAAICLEVRELLRLEPAHPMLNPFQSKSASGQN